MTAESEFIEFDYTGRVDGVVFDTTRARDAPRGSKGPFKPAVVKLGSGQLIPGLDSFLRGKSAGDYTVTIPAEQAFGKKQSTMLKLVPLKTFGKEAQRLVPNMPVTIGEHQGVVKSISGGRVVVDFNHRLAGQAVEYTVTLHPPVTAPEKKVGAIVKAMLGVELPVTHEDGKTVLKVPKGFPADGLVKEIAKHTGVTVTIVELDLKPHQHVHPDGSVHDNDAHKH